MELRERNQDQIPEGRMALVAEDVKDQIVQSEVSRRSPGAPFVFPWQVMRYGEAKYGDVSGEYGKVGPGKSQQSASFRGHGGIVTGREF